MFSNLLLCFSICRCVSVLLLCFLICHCVFCFVVVFSDLPLGFALHGHRKMCMNVMCTEVCDNVTFGSSQGFQHNETEASEETKAH